MKNADYWKDRFGQLEESMNAYGKQSVRAITPGFDEANREINSKIEIWLNRIATNNELSMADARKLLDADQLEEFHWSVEQYIKYGEENAIDQRWMKELENASAKYHISRLEALRIETQQQMEKAYGREISQVDDMARKVYTEGYYHTAYELQKGIGVGWDIASVDSSRLDKLVSDPWAADGRNFSDRIWRSKTQMVSELQTQLTRTCITGKAPDEAIKNMTQYVDGRFKNAKYAAGRLVMTEQAYFASASTKDCFSDLGVDQYEILATLDSRTSEICQEMDGKVFDMKEYEPGVTAPPFHVYCRSTTVPYFNDEFTADETRAARSADGKTYQVPASMTYKEWKPAMVGGGSKKGLKKVEVSKVPVSSFKPAETIEEAQAYAQRFVGTGFSPTFKNQIDYSGISLESANEINRTLDGIFSNSDIPPINGIKVISSTSKQGKKAFGEGADAIAAYNPVEQGIFLNKDILKNTKAYEKHLKESRDAWDLVMSDIDNLTTAQRELAMKYKEAGRSLVDETISGNIKHEMGHHVAWQVLDAETNNSVGSRMSKFAPKISGYANASKNEYLAESYAAYLNGETSLLDPEYVKYLNAKKVAISHERGKIKEIEKVISMPDTKFTEYALNPLKQPAKAKAFKLIGYTKDNYEDLRKAIEDKIDEKLFVEKGDIGFGMRYECIVKITGPNGKTAHVLTAWIEEKSGDKRLTSVYVTNRGITK